MWKHLLRIIEVFGIECDKLVFVLWSIIFSCVVQKKLVLSYKYNPLSSPHCAAPSRYWKKLQNLLVSLTNSIEAIVSLLVLLFLFLGIFALLGTQLFGAKFPSHHMHRGWTSDVRMSRSSFDSFSQSMQTVFQVILWSIQDVEKGSLPNPLNP